MHDDPTLDPVGRLVEDFKERYRRGQRPSISDYTQQHPQHAERLRQVLPMVALMEDAGSSGGSTHSAAGGASGRMPEQLGGYRLLQEIGRGGMGIVYEAEQVALGRHVAVKVLPQQAAAAGGRERFLRETKATARLHHTNIVPVYEVGEAGDCCYYAMQYIRGQPLDRVLAELRQLRKLAKSPTERIDPGGEATVARSLLMGPVPPPPAPQSPESSATLQLTGPSDSTHTTNDSRFYQRSVARVGIQVAEALDHAHRQGIVHRDIKPANLLLDADARVWVTDFGLAKTEGAALTRDGTLLGTLRYMAPERFRGWSDPRSDIYSLGLTLFEMLALRPAFDAADQAVLIEQIVGQAPRPLRKLDPRISPDLETIVLKAIDKEPSRRYQTAAELASDLQRYLEDRPILARRTGAIERARRWCRRNPVVSGLAAAVVLSALVGITGVMWQWRAAVASAALANRRASQLADKTREAESSARLARSQERQAKAERDKTQAANERLRWANYVAEINLAKQAWDAGGVVRVRELLDRLRPQAAQTDFRDFEWHYLDRLCSQRLLFTREFTAPVLQIAASPDGERVAVGLQNGWLVVLDAATANVLWGPIRTFNSRIKGLAFSADSQWLAVAATRSVTVYQTETGQYEFSKDAESAAWGLAFHPEGKLLAAGLLDGTVQLWSLTTGQDDPPPLPGHSGMVRDVAFSADGRYLASASADGRVIVRSTQTFEPLAYSPLAGNKDGVLSLAFDRDSRLLAAAGVNRQTQVWDLATGQPLFARPVVSAGTIQGVAFSPAGEALATGGGQQTLRLLDPRTGEPLSGHCTWRAHNSVIQSLAFAGGGRLVSGGADRQARFWSTAEISESIVIGRGHSRWSVAASPDGKLLASTLISRHVALWDAHTLEHFRTLEASGAAMSLAFSPDSRRLACGYGDGQVFIWDVEGGGSQPLVLDPPLDDQVLSLVFSPNGELLATGARERTSRDANMLWLWDARTGRQIREFRGELPRSGHTAGVFSVAFSPDGARLISGSGDRSVRLWDVATGRELAPLRDQHVADVRCVAYSPDGNQIADASSDGTVNVRDALTGKQVLTLAGHTGPVHCVAYSQNSRRIATCSVDRTVKLWDAPTGQELLSLAGHTEAITCVAFSPDGRCLYSLSSDRSLRLWDARPLTVSPR